MYSISGGPCFFPYVLVSCINLDISEEGTSLMGAVKIQELIVFCTFLVFMQNIKCSVYLHSDDAETSFLNETRW